MTNKSSTGVSYGVVAILVIIAFAVGAGVGVGGFIFATGGDGTASRSVQDAIAEIEADNDAQVAEDTDETASEDEDMADAEDVTSEDADAQAADESEETAGEDEATEAEDTEDMASDESMTSEAVEFSIVTDESTATFTLEEDLRGERVTVVGTTPDVGGTITVDLDNPSASSVGTIAVNARTIATDNDFRDRAIRSRILKSAEDQFEFIIFEPTSLSNFSAESVSVGDTLTFDITGNLTITGVTLEVVFNTSVTVDSETQLTGTATSNVLYADYGLVIPDVPGVANITDDVDLAINFVASAGASES